MMKKTNHRHEQKKKIQKLNSYDEEKLECYDIISKIQMLRGWRWSWESLLFNIFNFILITKLYNHYLIFTHFPYIVGDKIPNEWKKTNTSMAWSCD